MKKAPEKILVVSLSNLGDVVLTLPVFESLSRHFPGAAIDVIVGAGGMDVFKGDPRIREIIPYDKRAPFAKKIEFLKSIRAKRYDLIVDLRYSLIGLLGGAAKRNSYFSPRKKFKHRSPKHMVALSGITNDVVPKNGFLRASAGGPEIGEGKIVVAAVGSKSDTKKWPMEHYAALLDRLSAHAGCKIVFAGDTHDTADTTRVRSLMKNASLDLTGKTDFKALVSVMNRASLVITNDSAPLHIADALEVPVLALFGPTDPKKYGPRLASSKALFRATFCSPCEKAQCRYKHECLKELGVDEAYVAAVKILEDVSRPPDLKILVIRLDRIGDAVLSLPTVESIRERFPNAKISVMTRPATAEVFSGHPCVDDVILYQYEGNGRHRGILGYVRFLKEIVERHFDIAFVLHPSTRSHLLPFLAGIPYRAGVNKSLPFLLTHRAEDKRNLGLRHESEYALDVLRAFAIPVTLPKNPQIAVFTEQQEKVSKLVGNNRRWIAFHAGASCPSKQWPLERFIEVAHRLLASSEDYYVAIVGGEEEKEKGRQFSAALGHRALDLTGKLSLKELAAFFERCELLISTDSGPAHVAAASGIRVLGVFGRNDPGLSVRRWKPLGEGHVAIHKDVGCAVCLAHACTIGFECLKAVSVEEVFDAAKQMLASPVLI